MRVCVCVPTGNTIIDFIGLVLQYEFDNYVCLRKKS